MVESEVEILLVEDNPHDAELTLRALKHAPKVILLDLKLPKVDGLEIPRRLKGDERISSRWW